jgi:hypothetical protein
LDEYDSAGKTNIEYLPQLKPFQAVSIDRHRPVTLIFYQNLFVYWSAKGDRKRMGARPRPILGKLTHHFGGADIGSSIFRACTTLWRGLSYANKAEYEYADEKKRAHYDPQRKLDDKNV